MKQFLIIISTFALMLMISSCEETCEVCETSQQIITAGVETYDGIITEETEYCGDELDAVKDLAVSTSTEAIGLITETIVTVTCK